MKTMKLFILSLALSATVVLSGCVRDDNPYPDLSGTSWVRTEIWGYQKLSFTDNTVTHIIKTNDEITTHTFNYHEEGDSFGSHYYSWINDYDHFCYKVYSYGKNNIQMTQIPPDNTQYSLDVIGGWIFTKE